MSSFFLPEGVRGVENREWLEPVPERRRGSVMNHFTWWFMWGMKGGEKGCKKGSLILWPENGWGHKRSCLRTLLRAFFRRASVFGSNGPLSTSVPISVFNGNKPMQSVNVYHYGFHVSNPIRKVSMQWRPNTLSVPQMSLATLTQSVMRSEM